MDIAPRDWAGEPEFQRIASFSGLTKLECFDTTPSAGFQWLLHMSLEELSLIHCPDAELKLFQPSCLTALRELTIHENLEEFREKLEVHDPEAEQKAEQLAQAGKNLLSIPNLSHMSGSCKLFMVAGFEGLEGWRREAPESRHHCSNHHSHVRSCIGCSDAFHMWTKL